MKEKGCRRVILSVAALIIYIPANRKASVRDIFLFLASPVRFSKTSWVGGEGKRCRRIFTLRDDPFGKHANGSGERARGLFFIFALSPFIFNGLGKGEKGVSAGFTLIGSVFSKHTSGSGAIAHDPFPSCLRLFRFSGAGGGD